MEQPPKLKREYQQRKKAGRSDSSSGGGKGGEWSQEDMLNDLDETMQDDNNDSTTVNNKNDNDEMSIDDNNNNADNMSITLRDDDDDDSVDDDNDAINNMLQQKLSSYSLDCYPYTFSPLLLFTSNGYFDRGYSNYNAVAAFFAPALADLGVVKNSDDDDDESGVGTTSVAADAAAAATSSPDSNRSNHHHDQSPTRSPPRKSPRNSTGSDENASPTHHEVNNGGGGINMLHGVIYDRKNMTYDELFNHIVATQSLVTCCIDAHFTSFQILNSKTLIYYDPMSPNIRVAKGQESVARAALFLLMKCKYGDDVHVQENKNYYTGNSSSSLQRMIYALWKDINQMTMGSLNQIRWTSLPLNLDRYLFINSNSDPGQMSTQLTGCTCYFQVYLFAVLCKVGKPYISPDKNAIELADAALLEEASVRIAQFLLTFFLEPESRVCRPLTNNNFILDFYRYEQSPYFRAFVKYLEGKGIPVPKYSAQFEGVMGYFAMVKSLHGYDRFTLEGATASTPNSKSLQFIQSTDGAAWKLCHGDYYKYRATNLMFGCNAGAMSDMVSFCNFNAWRKNQLLPFHSTLHDKVEELAREVTDRRLTKYRDYYFMPQFEVGQKELIDIHHYTYLIDMCSLGKAPEALAQLVYDMNEILAHQIYFSTQNRNNYHKMMKTDQFIYSKAYKIFLQHFMGVEWFSEYIGLGLSDINPKEKDINCLTQTVFYTHDLMRSQMYRQEYEFEKECINQMARTNWRRFTSFFNGKHIPSRSYRAEISIGRGYTYSKYNTLMHFLNIAEAYWSNPDVNNIQVFGKDIRTLLAISCQKIFFDPRHCGYYYYGPLELRQNYRVELDLALGSVAGAAGPQVSMSSGGRNEFNHLTIVDRVYEFSYLKGILQKLFESANGVRFKSDNGVLNLLLLSLQLDFGLFDEYAKLLNIPFMKDLQHEADTKELQVEIANLIYDFDRKHNADSVTRSKVETLIFQASYNFIVNKNFDLHSPQFKLIQMLNGDPDYQEYLLLCKIYMSLCQINKSVEVDYYKIKCNGLFHIVIPQNFSKKISDYLEQITIHHSFSESDGIMKYDDISVFDLRPHQPEINLYTIKLQSKTDIQSMVKYIEFTNVFQTLSTDEQYLIFIGDNVILVDVVDGGEMNIRINQVDANISTIFFNEAISFIPCFKYTEGEDVIMFTSRNIHYLVDKGGQYCPDYYGMKHELIDCIISDELYCDLNDDPAFRQSKLSDLVTESKVVVYFPDYLLLVSSRQQLINLLDYAIYIRNISFFILVLFMLERTSMTLTYKEKKDKVVQITGPWKEAILYMMGNRQISRYDSIFKKQFFDINQYKHLPLREFIDKLCENFPRYQRFVDGEYQIVPREKQKRFLERIICGEECFHFSEVGSGKTKVIMPLLCQIFLSSNLEAHKHLARGGKKKNVLVILVPEHLVPDACTQVYRHCLNLNFRQDYKIFDDILALLHPKVHLGPERKTIFVTSFNQFKKALTYDKICSKVRPYREQTLVVCDEVDDFLDRDKLVFNICCNTSNTFDQPTMDYYHETSYAAYHGKGYPNDACDLSPNPSYWKELHAKFVAIHQEIQDASKSLNKSFGIFNEKTLRHCTTSISHDIEGYKALIARPYESVNRAMPGSYYSDVERTIFLTFVILSEDIAKYNELFQSERKFITFEYWKQYLSELDYDELVYGHDNLYEITEKHPKTLGGLIKFLYVIILKRMEVRDQSKSVNSVDIIFNFDCIGFTGTPFLDNYPTSDYIRHQREDDIPPCIDRSFYAYTNENLPQQEFEDRFYRFQGQNSNVKVQYLSSDFMGESLKRGEMDTLEAIFNQESSSSDAMPVDGSKTAAFNVIVDLCGIFKLSTIYDVRSLILKQFGADCFHYIYHIDQTDGSDRVLCIKTQNDVAFDEEFYKYLCRTYGAKLREKIFFFIDNRNYIGKDVPYQLVFQKHFNVPLFMKSVVIAHDVADFSKIWQAMGRSRTMNDTTFSIYKSSIPDGMNGEHGSEPVDIKKLPLTKLLYTRNCDCKMAGNLSSIYQTLIALFNLSKNSFYYTDEIVNTFIEKMEKTILKKVTRLENKLADVLTQHVVPARILQHIFGDKFGRSSNEAISGSSLSVEMVNELIRQIVRQKFEQRLPSGDIFDDYIRFLSGEQVSLMEISYTKQQQKQKQKQKAKSQDNDTMDEFKRQHQLPIAKNVDDYFMSTIRGDEDTVKSMLGLPVSIPIFTLYYSSGGRQNAINVYPTIQFMYSHHINPKYITDDVRGVLNGAQDLSQYYEDFLAAVAAETKMEEWDGKSESGALHTEAKVNRIRQNPHYSLVGVRPGVYIIGMKDQFNINDMETHRLRDNLQCAIDEVGFVLFDKTNTKSVDQFGPYFIELYLLLDALSKQEVAQNVITYYCHHKDKLEKGLERYDEKRGKGFICWRFLMNQSVFET